MWTRILIIQKMHHFTHRENLTKYKQSTIESVYSYRKIFQFFTSQCKKVHDPVIHFLFWLSNITVSKAELYSHLICNHFSRKCRKVVLQTRIFFSGQPLFSNLKKMWIYSVKPPFFLVNHFSRTRFLKPDFLNHFSIPF